MPLRFQPDSRVEDAQIQVILERGGQLLIEAQEQDPEKAEQLRTRMEELKVGHHGFYPVSLLCVSDINDIQIWFSPDFSSSDWQRDAGNLSYC